MIVYIERFDGKIKGVYANPQPDYAEETADDESAEVVAFKASLEPDKTSEVNKHQTFKTQVQQAIEANANYLAIPKPTAAQVKTQTEDLTRQINAIIKRIVRLD